MLCQKSKDRLKTKHRKVYDWFEKGEFIDQSCLSA